jgi:hypothetical protein
MDCAFDGVSCGLPFHNLALSWQAHRQFLRADAKPKGSERGCVQHSSRLHRQSARNPYLLVSHQLRLEQLYILLFARLSIPQIAPWLSPFACWSPLPCLLPQHTACAVRSRFEGIHHVKSEQRKAKLSCCTARMMRWLDLASLVACLVV